MIIKNSPCVCLTESPKDLLSSDILYDITGNKYKPFGFIFSKEALYEKGARPVIYQPKEELNLLDETIHWRHATLDFTKEINYSWQREWRINKNLNVSFDNSVILLPSKEWHTRFVEQLDAEFDLHKEAFFSANKMTSGTLSAKKILKDFKHDILNWEYHLADGKKINQQ